MPPEIPGFVYDDARGRYFRVQENHQNTQHVALRGAPPDSSGIASAPSYIPTSGDGREVRAAVGATNNVSGTQRGAVGARYTREVVEGQKRARDGDGGQRRRQKEREERRRHDASKVKQLQRPRRGRRMADEFDLRLRLGGATNGQAISVEGLIKQRYATTMSAYHVVDGGGDDDAVGTSAVFVVDPVSKELFTCQRHNRGRGEEFCVMPYSEQPPPDRSDTLPQESSYAVAGTTGAKWSASDAIPILDSAPLHTATVAADGCVVWVTHGLRRVHDARVHDLCQVHVSTRYASFGADVPWAQWREDFGEWGTQCYMLATTVVWHVSASPARDGMVVFATSEGPIVQDVSARTEITLGGKWKEAMCVAWKDERVWLAGARDGTVRMGDVRDPRAVVGRLKHPDGVSAVQGMRPRCDWGVLVWGLQSSAVYDLRWTKTQTQQDPNPVYNRPNRVRARPSTKPLFAFDLPQVRMQRQYGMGFAFDANASVVAAAWPASLGQAKIGLWDATTGMILESALEKRSFEVSPCMQFVDLEGRGDAAKSLFVGGRDTGSVTYPKGTIQAWEV